MTTVAPPHLHVVLFPFMAKGHTIPILQLARLLLRHHNATVTLFTTPANRPYISASLSDTPTSIITLPFPHTISDVESVDKLPSMSLFYSFVSSTKLMKPHFEQAIRSLKTPVTFMVTDGFFGWTLDSANVFNIPRLVLYSMSNFTITISRVVTLNPHLFHGKTDDDRVTVPEFPWISATRTEFEDAFTGRDPDSPLSKWVTEQVNATTRSYGVVTNSFLELEPVYAEYWNSKLGPKSWSIGPFCAWLGATQVPSRDQSQRPSWMVWLDTRLQLRRPVLYVAFGSQAEVSVEQIEEIKVGLERSEVDFLWVVRRPGSESSGFGSGLGLDDGFAERVKEKGILVGEWVNQREILKHEAVKGFVSHCGWNSVLESICAAVPILAWPMTAEQPLNARFVVEEVKIGVRVETSDGSVTGFVKGEELQRKVKELMEGEKAEEMRKRVEEMSAAALKAVGDGGSSRRSLNDLIVELQTRSN